MNHKEPSDIRKLSPPELGQLLRDLTDPGEETEEYVDEEDESARNESD